MGNVKHIWYRYVEADHKRQSISKFDSRVLTFWNTRQNVWRGTISFDWVLPNLQLNLIRFDSLSHTHILTNNSSTSLAGLLIYDRNNPFPRFFSATLTHFKHWLQTNIGMNATQNLSLLSSFEVLLCSVFKSFCSGVENSPFWRL